MDIPFMHRNACFYAIVIAAALVAGPCLARTPTEQIGNAQLKKMIVDVDSTLKMTDSVAERLYVCGQLPEGVFKKYRIERNEYDFLRDGSDLNGDRGAILSIAMSAKRLAMIMMRMGREAHKHKDSECANKVGRLVNGDAVAPIPVK